MEKMMPWNEERTNKELRISLVNRERMKELLNIDKVKKRSFL